jgi:cyanate lyase
MKLPKPLAEKAATLFGLSEVEKRMLNEVPTRGVAMPPTDPLLYRFYELVMVNGPALMSAIDFDLEKDRLANPKGDRVRLVMSGKFLALQILRRRTGAAGDRPQGGVSKTGLFTK